LIIGKKLFILPSVVRVDGMRRKTILYASGVLLVCIVMILGYFAFWADKNVTVYDGRFKVLDYVISRGTTHKIYRGNQTTGRIRAMLKNRLGLKFINVPPAVETIGPKNLETREFFMFYEGDFPYKELNGLRAVLTNDKNIHEELSGGNLFIQSEQIFNGGYFLPVLPANDDSFRIELKLYSPGEPVASIRLGKIYRHYRGPKSGK
jgi:hypothetical protein